VRAKWRGVEPAPAAIANALRANPPIPVLKLQALACGGPPR
jgi:hypothetical protein